MRDPSVMIMVSYEIRENELSNDVYIFEHKDPHCRLSVFEPTCVTEIKELIMKSPSKSRELDPVPTSLIKQNIDVFAKYITIHCKQLSFLWLFP